ncbi:MAG: hypothetical protein ACKVOR_14245, partial [Flavobacteriales bacterium]
TNQTFFRSAGMFEINASQNGNEVFLQDDKDITVNFADTDTASVFNFYEYDDGSGTWVDNGAAAPAVQDALMPQPKTLSLAFNKYISTPAGRKRQALLDTVTYHNRFYDLRYSNCNLESTMTYKKSWHSESTNSLARDHRIKVRRVKRTRGHHVVFDLECNTGLNDELKRLGANHWMVLDESKSKTFRKKFSWKKEYTDVRVVQEGEGFVITLKNKNDKQLIQINAKPVTLVKDKMRKQYKDQQVNYKAYKKRLDQKQRRYDKVLAKKKKREDRWLKRVNGKSKTEVEIWEEVRPLMTADEKEMSFEQWTNYCDSLEAAFKCEFNAFEASQYAFTRGLALSGFGIYNCDQIERLEEPVTIYASFQNESGKKFNSKMTYVVDPNLNGVLCYGDMYKGLSSKKFAVSAANNFYLITVDETGALALASSEQLTEKSFLSHRTYTFEMEELENVSMAELKTRMGW